MLAPSPFEGDGRDSAFGPRTYSVNTESEEGSPESFKKTPSASPDEQTQLMSSRLFQAFPSTPKHDSPKKSPVTTPAAKKDDYEDRPTLPKSTVRKDTPRAGSSVKPIARFPYLWRTYDQTPKRIAFSSEDYEDTKTVSLSPSPTVKKDTDDAGEDDPDQPLSAHKLRETAKHLYGLPASPPPKDSRVPSPSRGTLATITPPQPSRPSPVPAEQLTSSDTATAVSEILASRHPRSVKVIHIQKRKTESYDYKQSSSMSPPQRDSGRNDNGAYKESCF